MQFESCSADITDTPFIESLLLAGARKGHFNPELLSQRSSLRKDVHSMIARQRLLDSPLYAEATIYKVNRHRAGFSLMSGITDKPDGIEIYAISLHKTFRGLGLGSMILDDILTQWLPRCDVYARCSAASEMLYQMLVRRQFTYLSNLPSGTRILHCPQLPHLAQA
jgi:GNAT superfamily N-acetyltransferase